VSETANISVLHVDDEPDFADLAADMLEREDNRFTVATATSASEGLERLAADNFDCIVSDYDMPGENGIEFLRQVRDEYPDHPFILFTGKGNEDVASEAMSAGVTDYLQKDSGAEQYELLANRIRNAVERAQAQRDRRRHLDAIEAAREGISILDNDDEFVYVNEAYADLYGYDPDDLLGEHWAMLYCDDDVQRIQDEILPTVEAEGYWRGETTGVRADGSTFVEDHTLALTDTGELVCTVRDITERKKRERALRHLQQRTQELMHTATNEETARVAVEAAHDVVDVPLSGCHLVDDEQRRLEPTAVVDTVREEIGDPPAYERTVDDAPAGEVVWQVFEHGEPLVIDDTREYGRLAEVTPARSAIIYPLDDYGVFIVSATEPNAFDDTDTTLTEIIATSLKTALERVDREQTLERRNDRLNEFTSVVSHDLRNPLNVATGRLELASEECDSQYLTDVARAHDRIETLLDDLLTLARHGERVEERETVELADLTDACWRTVVTADATLVTETSQTIQAEPSRLKQLLENLFRNAVEHAGEDVTVTVGDLDAGFYIADDGSGIPAEEHDAVFEAGHSTVDDGTGFGLTIVQEVAETHGWEISVTDSENGGARFEITGVETAAA
jgi:PAS domain S-box-containing protein